MSNPKQLLKEAQDEWYKKLKKSGFDDIEQDEDRLKKWASSSFKGKINGARHNEKQAFTDAKEEYYRRAGHFLYDHEFASAFQRRIWELHAEGKSLREISKAVRKMNTKMKVNKDNIQPIVKALAKVMIKKYIGVDNGQE